LADSYKEEIDMSKHTPEFTQPQLPFAKLCECGCGQPAPLATTTDAKRGYVKGQPVRFIAHHHMKGRRTRTVEDRFWAKVAKGGPQDCWTWTGCHDGYGYGHIRIEGHAVYAHRLSYELHHGPLPDGLYVCHNCPTGDNPSCVNPAHLFLGTAKDNTQDMLSKGRQRYVSRPGEANPYAKLTDEIVLDIRRRITTGETKAALAREYGVSHVTISRIINRKTWKHLP
jgi:HNH endonuclease